MRSTWNCRAWAPMQPMIRGKSATDCGVEASASVGDVTVTSRRYRPGCDSLYLFPHHGGHALGVTLATRTPGQRPNLVRYSAVDVTDTAIVSTVAPACAELAAAWLLAAANGCKFVRVRRPCTSTGVMVTVTVGMRAAASPSSAAPALPGESAGCWGRSG